jgi:hypothetical protein
MGFKLNLTNDEIKAAQNTGFAALAAGTYGAIIYEVKEKQSKAGNDMYEIDFKITEGQEGVGRKQRSWFVVSGKALFSVVGLLKALDLPYPGKDTEPGEFEFPDGEDFLGREVNIKLAQESYQGVDDDGKQATMYRNNVKGVYAYDPERITQATDEDAPASGQFL